MDGLFPVTGTFPPPREFQARAHEQLREGFRDGHRCQVLMASTGAGKTYLGLRAISEALQRGKRAVFVCDRTTLINQTSATADRYGLDHGVIQADHYRAKPWLPFQIASAQTLARRERPQADLIVVDECHTQLAAWTDWVQDTRAAVIGLSATPFSKGLGVLFSRVVNATTMAELVREGVLVPMRIKTCVKPDMKGAAVNTRGEWAEEDAGKRGMEIVGDVVTEWIKHGEGRKTICFGASVNHCEALNRQFREMGVASALFTGHTSAAEREQLLADFQSGALRVLISVEALAKGFDVPDVGCVIDCRPLRKSLSTAIQMWGRGLRCAPGKTDCILLDHSGNILRFAGDFERLYHEGLDQLDDGEKLDRDVRKEPEEKEQVGCPNCGYRPFLRRCMACGHERPVQALVEAVPGQMREIVINGKRYAENARDLWAQCMSYAREHSEPHKQWWRAKFIYRDITGVMPPDDFRIDAPQVMVSSAVLNKIRAAQIRYRKAKQRQAA